MSSTSKAALHIRLAYVLGLIEGASLLLAQGTIKDSIKARRALSIAQKLTHEIIKDVLNKNI